MDHSCVKYKVGYYDRNDKRKYRTVATKAEALDLLTELVIPFPLEKEV